MRLVRLGVALLAAFCAAGLTASAAPEPGELGGPARAPHMATLEYQLYSVGLHPLDFTVDVALESGRYEIAVRGHTLGIVDFFVRWVTHSVTEGGFVAGRPAPTLSRSVNRFHGTPRRIDLAYHDGTPTASVDPPPQDDDRDPVRPDQIEGTLDSSSAALDVVMRVAHGESCQARERVFDGRRRFDMVVTDRGTARLEANKYSAFAGPAQVCDFTIERIAGFNRRRSTGYDSAQPEEAVYRSWSMVVLPGLPALPVRLEGDGSLGAFHLYLVAAHPSDQRPSFADLK